MNEITPYGKYVPRPNENRQFQSPCQLDLKDDWEIQTFMRSNSMGSYATGSSIVSESSS